MTGRLSPRAQGAVVGLDVEQATSETVVSVVRHAEGLHELLAVARSLGPRAVSVQQVTTVAGIAPSVSLEAWP